MWRAGGVGGCGVAETAAQVEQVFQPVRVKISPTPNPSNTRRTLECGEFSPLCVVRVLAPRFLREAPLTSASGVEWCAPPPVSARRYAPGAAQPTSRLLPQSGENSPHSKTPRKIRGLAGFRRVSKHSHFLLAPGSTTTNLRQRIRLRRIQQPTTSPTTQTTTLT
jgi:hypothetical protein